MPTYLYLNVKMPSRLGLRIRAGRERVPMHRVYYEQLVDVDADVVDSNVNVALSRSQEFFQ